MSVTGVGKLHPVGGIQPVAYFIVKTMPFRRRREMRRERRKEGEMKKMRRHKTVTIGPAQKRFANLWWLRYNRKQTIYFLPFEGTVRFVHVLEANQTPRSAAQMQCKEDTKPSPCHNDTAYIAGVVPMPHVGREVGSMARSEPRWEGGWRQKR